jgi:hypothetical protein
VPDLSEQSLSSRRNLVRMAAFTLPRPPRRGEGKVWKLATPDTARPTNGRRTNDGFLLDATDPKRRMKGSNGAFSPIRRVVNHRLRSAATGRSRGAFRNAGHLVEWIRL